MYSSSVSNCSNAYLEEADRPHGNLVDEGTHSEQRTEQETILPDYYAEDNQDGGIAAAEEDGYVGMEDGDGYGMDWIGMEIGDDEMNPDDIPVSYHNALVFNETYQNHLHTVIENLYAALQANRNRQVELEHELHELESGQSLDDNIQGGGHTLASSLTSNTSAICTKKAALCVFAAPYFKVGLQR